MLVSFKSMTIFLCLIGICALLIHSATAVHLKPLNRMKKAHEICNDAITVCNGGSIANNDWETSQDACVYACFFCEFNENCDNK